MAVAAHAGVGVAGTHLIRVSENAIYRLRGGLIARIARAGQLLVARKELEVARWLAGEGIPAVQPIEGLDQPIVVHGHPVTFWHELPPHQHASRVELATVLRTLHARPIPAFDLPQLDPFDHLAERIDGAASISDSDRDFLRGHLADLKARYTSLPAGLPQRVVHGDAWPGNVARTDDGSLIVLDLERVAIGAPEWDLLHTAISHATVGAVPGQEYRQFCRTYGLDVTCWQGYPLLRDIRELRLTLFAAQMATDDPRQHQQAAHRLACLRGELGPRPWPGWTAVP